MKKPLLVAAAALGLLALGAAPASAAGNSIDPGDSLYALWCDGDAAPWQLFSVDSPTGALTAIGSGTPFDDSACSYQAAYDPSTGASYYVQTSMGYSALAAIDVATGVSTTIGEFFTIDGEFPLDIYVDAIAIGGDGAAYALNEGDLYSIDLETAELFFIGETVEGVYAFAWDSVTDGFYAITSDNEISQIDVEDGSFSLAGQITFPDEDINNHYTYSLQFDGAGTLWLEVDFQGDDFYESSVWSVTFAALDAPVLSGFTTLGDEYEYIESLLIIPGTPAPALAATGADATPAIAAAGILLIGGAVLLLRRRTA